MKRKSAAKVLAAIAIAGVLGSSPAYAAVDASRTGSRSWATTSTVYNKDTSADNNFTSAPWLRSTGAEGSLINRSGANNTVSKALTSVTHVKACVSRPAPLAMACTAWNEG